MEVKYSKSDDPCVNGTLDNPYKPLETLEGDGKSGHFGESEATDAQDKNRNGNGDDSFRARMEQSNVNGQSIMLLNSGISEAFRRILIYAFALEFPKETERAWAVAVSIVGRTGVKIMFNEITRSENF
jgi:hypothetical protein